MTSCAIALVFDTRLENKDSVGGIEDTFQEIVESFGFGHFCIRPSLSVSEGFNRSTIPAYWSSNGWVKKWVATRYMQTSPLIARLPQHRQGIIRWSTLKEELEQGDHEIFGELFERGVCDGRLSTFKIDTHQFEVLLLATQASCLDFADEMAMHLASVRCGYKLFLCEQRPKPNCVSLSARERECLRWVAAGKTDWELSKILSISEKTAQEHVSRAIGKLNAATRAHAVAIALTGNLISL